METEISMTNLIGYEENFSILLNQMTLLNVSVINDIPTTTF